MPINVKRWKPIVHTWLSRWDRGHEFTLPDIYGAVREMRQQRPGKVNRHIRAKIRQSLQEICAEGDHVLERVARGRYRIPYLPGHAPRKPVVVAPSLRDDLVRAAIARCVAEVVAIILPRK